MNDVYLMTELDKCRFIIEKQLDEIKKLRRYNKIMRDALVAIDSPETHVESNKWARLALQRVGEE